MMTPLGAGSIGSANLPMQDRQIGDALAIGPSRSPTIGFGHANVSHQGFDDNSGMKKPDGLCVTQAVSPEL
jgi:hypothetical protein